MRRTDRKTWMALSGLGIVLAISVLAAAAGPGSHRGANGTMTASAMETLTQEQLQRLDEVRAGMEKETLPWERSIEAKRMEVKGVLAAPDPDLDRVRGLRNQIRELEAKLDEAWYKASSEVSSFLTPEQRAQYADPAAWLMGASGWYDGWSCPWDASGLGGDGRHERCRYRSSADRDRYSSRDRSGYRTDTCCG